MKISLNNKSSQLGLILSDDIAEQEKAALLMESRRRNRYQDDNPYTSFYSHYYDDEDYVGLPESDEIYDDSEYLSDSDLDIFLSGVADFPCKAYWQTYENGFLIPEEVVTFSSYKEFNDWAADEGIKICKQLVYDLYMHGTLHITYDPMNCYNNTNDLIWNISLRDLSDSVAVILSDYDYDD